jgi:hypothetical protein
MSKTVKALIQEAHDWMEEMKARDRTKTRDTLLTCPTPAEWDRYVKSIPRADLGKVYTGILDALEAADRDNVFAQVDAYRAQGRWKKDASGALVTDAASTNDKFGRWDQAKVNRSINDRNREFHNQRPITHPVGSI